MSSRIGVGVTHLVALPVPLYGCSAPYSPIELGDEKAQVGVDNAFCGENLFELAVVGRPAHPFRFGHIVAYAAISAKLAAQFGVTTRLAPRRTLSWTKGEREIPRRRPAFHAARPKNDFSSLKGLKLVGSIGSVRQE
jgi:hypothetical protein